MRPEFNLKTILLGTGILAVSFFVSLKAMDWLSPSAINKPVLTALPPLPPVNRASSIIAPITIPLAVIRDAAERAAPRNFAGKADNPVAHILQNADIGWTASRGAISATGADNTLSLTTPLSGTLKVKGSLSAEAEGAIGNALGNLLGGNVAKQIGRVNIKNLNANAEIKGNVVMTARPVLTANWRIDPGMTAQVHLGDTNLSVAGARVTMRWATVAERSPAPASTFPLRSSPSLTVRSTNRSRACNSASATTRSWSTAHACNGHRCAARFHCRARPDCRTCISN